MKSVVWALVLFVLAAARPAFASTRVAVFIMAEDDRPLSDNLTEVAIARLAEKSGYELLGLRELESRLNELSTVKSDGLRACLAHPGCLSEVGTTAGVDSVVVGDVRREDERYRLEISFVDGRSGAQKARLSREAPLDMEQLISSIQAGVYEIVPAAEPEPPRAPVALFPVPPSASHQASPVLKDAPQAEKKPATSSVLPYVAYGAAALSVVAFSAAAVTGTLATAPPSGNGRAAVQEDVERRQNYASVANGLFVTGGVLAGVSAVSFVVWLK